MSEAARVVLTVPADASFVRLARLAAADAGSRAGLTLEEIDDLRIAVGELCMQVMGPGDATTSLTFAISPGRVEIDGVGPPALETDFTEISKSIVAAVADAHEVSTNGQHAPVPSHEAVGPGPRVAAPRQARTRRFSRLVGAHPAGAAQRRPVAGVGTLVLGLAAPQAELAALPGPGLARALHGAGRTEGAGQALAARLAAGPLERRREEEVRAALALRPLPPRRGAVPRLDLVGDGCCRHDHPFRGVPYGGTGRSDPVYPSSPEGETSPGGGFRRRGGAGPAAA